jgi:RNA 3'-terminal phosphate cyclase (ATP)
LIPIDGLGGDGVGSVLRAALALSVATGRGFQITRFRSGQPREGLRPVDLGAVRALSLVCDAKVSGAFDGSLDLRFEPGPALAGSFAFDIGDGPTTAVLQALVLALSRVSERCHVDARGTTHMRGGATFHFCARHWLPAVAQLGFKSQLRLMRPSFAPRGDGRIWAQTAPLMRPGLLDWRARGARLGVTGVVACSRAKGDESKRIRAAARDHLWEMRRIESRWQVADLKASAPGMYVQIEVLFEHGRAAFGGLAEKGLRPEVLGDRTARALVKFLDGDDAVDAHLAEQLAVPCALAAGGSVATDRVSELLARQIGVLQSFGIEATLSGVIGGRGGFEIKGLCALDSAGNPR